MLKTVYSICCIMDFRKSFVYALSVKFSLCAIRAKSNPEICSRKFAVAIIETSSCDISRASKLKEQKVWV